MQIQNLIKNLAKISLDEWLFLSLFSKLYLFVILVLKPLHFIYLQESQSVM